MFRTRDFVLIFSTITFLLLAIGTTLLQRQSSKQVTESTLILVEDSPEEFSAEVFKREQVSREERLLALRQKIAESGELALSAPPEEVVVEDETLVSSPQGLQKCSEYGDFRGYWPVGVKLDVVEGARIAYLEGAGGGVATVLATTAVSLSAAAERNILLQLPAYPTKSAHSNCVESDVVGVAKDGSLIRNSEAGLYGVFGEATLVGYALDGFPIYGLSSYATDSCGGSVATGEYRYYLSSSREVILNCFAGLPASL